MLLYLQDPGVLASVCGRVLGLLKQDLDSTLPETSLPTCSASVDDATAGFREDYVQTFGAHLLGSDTLLILRKKLIVASICAVRP